jgi:hypothetical protein
MVLAGLSGASTWGCLFHHAEDCELIGTCARGSQGAASTSSGSGGGATPDECIPSKNTSPVQDSCGIFASSALGDDTIGDGTKYKPYKTLTKALMEADGRPVYACSETFAEALVLSREPDS